MERTLVTTCELKKSRPSDEWRLKWIEPANKLQLWKIRRDGGAEDILLEAVAGDGSVVMHVIFTNGSTYLVHRSGHSSIEKLSKYYVLKRKMAPADDSLAPQASKFLGLWKVGQESWSLRFERPALEGELGRAPGTAGCHMILEQVVVGPRCLERIIAPIIWKNCKVVENAAQDTVAAAEETVPEPKRARVPISATSINKAAISRGKKQAQKEALDLVKERGLDAIVRQEVSVGDAQEAIVKDCAHYVSYWWPREQVPLHLLPSFVSSKNHKIRYYLCRRCGTWDSQPYLLRHSKCTPLAPVNVLAEVGEERHERIPAGHHSAAASAAHNAHEHQQGAAAQSDCRGFCSNGSQQIGGSCAGAHEHVCAELEPGSAGEAKHVITAASPLLEPSMDCHTSEHCPAVKGNAALVAAAAVLPLATVSQTQDQALRKPVAYNFPDVELTYGEYGGFDEDEEDVLQEGMSDGEEPELPVDDEVPGHVADALDQGRIDLDGAGEEWSGRRPRFVGVEPMPRILQVLDWDCVGQDGMDRWVGPKGVVSKCPAHDKDACTFIRKGWNMVKVLDLDFYMSLRVPRLQCLVHKKLFRVTDADIMAQVEHAVREEPPGAIKLRPRVLRISAEGLVTWRAMMHVSAHLQQEAVFKKVADFWSKTYYTNAFSWLLSVGSWVGCVVREGSPLPLPDRAHLRTVKMFLCETLSILKALPTRGAECSERFQQLVERVQPGKLPVSDVNTRHGLQSMETSLRLLLALAASGSSSRVDTDGRIVAGGRTQVSPSIYIVRRIFYVLANKLMPPQCLAQQSVLREDPQVMLKIGTDHTHRSMNGLRGADGSRSNKYGRPLQVPFNALLLTITGATGCALAGVVVPSEEHKFTLAAILALYGIDSSEEGVWRALPKALEADGPTFRFIYKQVSAGGLCCNVIPQAWASDNVGVDRYLHQTLLSILLPTLCTRLLEGKDVRISFADGQGKLRFLEATDALAIAAAGGQPLDKDALAAVSMVMVQDIYHAKQRVLGAVDQHHPDFRSFDISLTKAFMLVNPREQCLLAGNDAGLQAREDELRDALDTLERRFSEAVSRDRMNVVQRTHRGVADVAELFQKGSFQICTDKKQLTEDDNLAGASTHCVASDQDAAAATLALPAATEAVLRSAPNAKPLAARMNASAMVYVDAARPNVNFGGSREKGQARLRSIGCYATVDQLAAWGLPATDLAAVRQACTDADAAKALSQKLHQYVSPGTPGWRSLRKAYSFTGSTALHSLGLTNLVSKALRSIPRYAERLGFGPKGAFRFHADPRRVVSATMIARGQIADDVSAESVIAINATMEKLRHLLAEMLRQEHQAKAGRRWDRQNLGDLSLQAQQQRSVYLDWGHAKEPYAALAFISRAAKELRLSDWRYEEGSLLPCQSIPHAAATPDLVARKGTTSSGQCMVVALKCKCPFSPSPEQGQCWFNPMKGPLNSKPGPPLDPAHIVQVHLQMDATGADEVFLVYWTMTCGVAVFNLRRCKRLIAALALAAQGVHCYLHSLPPDGTVDLHYTEKIHGVVELGQALLAYVEGSGSWSLKHCKGTNSRCLLPPQYLGEPGCIENVWIVDDAFSERRLGPSKATAALRDPGNSRFGGILARTSAQGKAGCKALSNLRSKSVIRGLVNNLAISARLGGASGTVPNEQLHRVLNDRVPQESVMGMSVKLACIPLAIYLYNYQKAAILTGRPGGGHGFDMDIASVHELILTGDEHHLPSTNLLVSFLDEETCRYTFAQLRHLGFRPNTRMLPKASWSRDEILRLAQACSRLCDGTADRSEGIHNWSQWIATYVFACTKDAYEVRKMIEKLAGVQICELDSESA